MVGGDTNSTAARSELLRVSLLRAVGGLSSLLRELSRISFEIDGQVPIDWMLKRVQFLVYELNAKVRVGIEHLDPQEKILALNEFFFNEKGFRVGTRDQVENANDWLMQNVLVHRTGSVELISVLYAVLAEKFGLQMEFVEFHRPENPTCLLLRWMDLDGQARYIDVRRSGHTLTSQEVLEALHLSHLQSKDIGKLLEPKKIDTVMVEYISQLKRRMSVESFGEKLLLLQNLLIAWRPSEIRFLAERAFISKGLGHLNSALSDLKRYFSFQDKERAPEEVVKLYGELSQKLQPDRPPQ